MAAFQTRLQDLRRDQSDAKAEIRVVLDRLAEKYGVAAKDVNLGMLSVDDALSDLTYAAQSDLEAKVDRETQR